jgi:hypothetical protein
MNSPEGTSVSFMPIELLICLGVAVLGSAAVARPEIRIIDANSAIDENGLMIVLLVQAATPKLE